MNDNLNAHMFILQSFQAAGAVGRHLYSRSEILATDECSRAAHISRVVQTSKQAAGGGLQCVSGYLLHSAGNSILALSSKCIISAAEELDPEESLHSTEGQSHM